MVADLHKFLPWLVGRAAALPKPLQRTLGDRLVDSALDVLNATVAASYSTASARLDAIDAAWFGDDDLLEPLRRRRGLPLGNLVSQTVANLHLAPLDDWLREHPAVVGFVR